MKYNEGEWEKRRRGNRERGSVEIEEKECLKESDWERRGATADEGGWKHAPPANTLTERLSVLKGNKKLMLASLLWQPHTLRVKITNDYISASIIRSI